MGEMVSVIVPVYNVKDYLQSCIESIIRQKYKLLEIILVDDGSTDGSGQLCDILAKNDNRIHVIHQRNMGVVSARNNGVRYAHGTYVMFIDADDWIAEDTLSLILPLMDQVDMVSFGVNREDELGKFSFKVDGYEEREYHNPKDLDTLFDTMIYDFVLEEHQRFTPWIWNKIYVRSLVLEVIKELDLNIKYAEDVVFLYRYILRCNAVRISHLCKYYYRYREESAIHKVNDTILMDINRVYINLKECFDEHYLCASLNKQLQRSILWFICAGVNDRMGFDSQIVNVPAFIFDLGIIYGKRIVLYGAGKAGQDAYHQMKEFKYDLVGWVDQNYCLFQNMGMEVKNPVEIGNMKYDIVFIAVKSETLAKKIREDLVRKGILEKNIIWQKPICIY